MSFKLESGDEHEAGLHEINVTPFIDVMLVLLIIFMVAAPLATVNVPLDLPVSSAQAQPEPQEPVVVSLQADLRVFVGETEVERAALGGVLHTLLGGDRDARVFLRADKTVPYGDLMRLMDALRDQGYHKVALVTLDQVEG
ncbi:TonB system transport protein ExbD [Pseudothauera nasutitermitis]|uniref:Biopolymer transport protein ExbD n=2 Tax=Betaproteobacteria TaxID=28216 RepID=A0A3M6QW01_9BURK|nr:MULTISPECIES: TonB system transport protein ExbD [Betaproteobacteria]RMX06759.1 TonB system transport protein ExbD [Corticibacter populi]RZS31656.1 outer membrane transport energization protein ExbD [Corticibacter populi]THF64891.1 TonB system transport protein ExbD [Pseudothauera nasutitermitis]